MSCKESLVRKVSAAEKEAQLKAELEASGLAYVKNGSRDRFGNLRLRPGGRPKKEVADRVGVAGGDASNTRRPGAEARRKELTAPALLAMSEMLLETEAAFWSQQGIPDAKLQTQLEQLLKKKWPGWSIDKLMEIKHNKHQFQQRCKDLQLGKMAGPGSLAPQGNTLGKIHRWRSSVGIRAEGGGRANAFLSHWQMVKIWHSFQRMLGQHINMQDCYLEFRDVVSREIHIIQGLGKLRTLSPKQEAQLKFMQDRLDKLAASPKYKESYTRRLCTWMGARFGTPSRYTELTPRQEHIRWELTMQGFDRALWLAAFGSELDLQKLVADVPRFMVLSAQQQQQLQQQQQQQQ